MDEFGSALKSGVRADQLPDWRLARSVLPVADLARRLFAGGEADTALKLVVLFALAKAEFAEATLEAPGSDSGGARKASGKCPEAVTELSLRVAEVTPGSAPEM